MSLSPHVVNKKKDILILSKGPGQGLEHTLTAEKLYSINFTEHNKVCKRFWNCSTFIALGKHFKEDFSVNNIKKTGLNKYVYDFSVHYNAIPVDDIIDIHKYLMKKHDIKECLGFLKSVFYSDSTF